MEKPEFDKYPEWFEETFGVSLFGKAASIYQFVIQKLFADFTKSDFWNKLNNNIANYDDEYYLNHGYRLLKITPLDIYTKSYESVINKSFRKNILLNQNFPNEPYAGWITPDNWFSFIKDLLRTSITVSYLDGVEFMVEKIKSLSSEYNYEFQVDYEAREEGYYAAHINVFGKFIIVDGEWNEVEISFPIEIQITTQLQEVIKGLLHNMYEDSRIRPRQTNDMKWQWDYKSEEFSSNYLGHILHYMEGMILDVRDKQKNKE